MTRPLARRRRTLPQTALAKIGCVLMAIAVLFGSARAGDRYFYCEGLGLSATDPCAQERHPPPCSPPCPLASVDRLPFDCCRLLIMPAMPEGAQSVVPVVPSAGIIAILPPLQGADASPWNLSVLVAREGERGRAPPTSSCERRARLMVFLT